MRAKKYDPTHEIEDITSEIANERWAQVERWGQQDWPSFRDETSRRQFAQASDRWHQINDARVADGSLSWDGILLEEVYEALSEADPHLRRQELIQVAAVAAGEVEALDRLLAEESTADETEEED